MTTLVEFASRSPEDQERAIRKGLPSHTLDQFCRAMGLQKGMVARSLGLALRTLNERERNKKAFLQWESERLLRMGRIQRLARQVFGTDAQVSRWLQEPDEFLEGRTPIEALQTDVGAAKVETLLGAMIHGVPV